MATGAIAVYRLETYRFIEKYRRFIRADPRTFPDFYPNKFGAGPWSAPRLGPTWKTPKLVGDVWPENDYPGEGAPAYLVPVFSPRAVDGLREFLEPNGELLPVRTPLGTYFAYNVTTVADALDHRQSLVHRSLASGHRLTGVRRFEFRPKLVDGLAIFKIPQMPVEICVTEPFVRRVKELGLNGMWITKLWPLPKGVHWEDSWKAQLERFKANAAVAERRVLPSHRNAPRRTGRRRAPTVLDLRKDVDDIGALLRRVMKWIGKQQPYWKAGDQFVSAIGVETSGWDLDAGPYVMCHVDTRDRHLNDGHWTHFNVASILRPRWSAFLRAIDGSDGERTVIDADGTEFNSGARNARVFKRICGSMVEALKNARERGVFDGLLRPSRCKLSVLDFDSGFHWSTSTAGKR